MSSEKDPNYEAIVHKLAFSAINEQRRARRWRIFFLFLIFIYLTPLALLMLNSSGIDILEADINTSSKHTALVKMEGVIASGEQAGSEVINPSLREAFKNKNTAAVVLEINSPGGSPVQSAHIYDEMVRLREKYPEKPLYVVVTDMAASGGYFVASAADKVFVNKSSIVGSIGVRMDSFGLVDLINNLGIERRLLTAGEHKGLLDPFLPEDETEKAYLQDMLDEVHQHFIKAVQDARGERLSDDPQLFSGLVWTGEKAIELGLADEYGSTHQVARDIVKEEKVVDFTAKEVLLDRLVARIGAAVGKSLSSQLSRGVLE